MDCPNCKRSMTDGTAKCECGYVFTAGTAPSAVRRRNKFAIASFVCGLAGLLIAVATEGGGQTFNPEAFFNPQPVSLASVIAIACLKALPGLIAIILGWEGGARVREIGSGRGLAIAGIVLGFIVVLGNIEPIFEAIRQS